MYLAYLRVSAADQNLARQEAAIQSWKEKNQIPTVMITGYGTW